MAAPQIETQAPAVATDAELHIITAQIERERLQIERDKLQVERDKLALENTFAKKWAAPLLALSGVIVAALLSAAAVIVTSILKEKEAITDQEQRIAIASEQATSRKDRLGLDYANFLLSHWPTFKGSAEDQTALVIASELLPIEVSRTVLPKLIEALGPPNPTPSVKKALDSLQPAYNLSGEWRCTTGCQASSKMSLIKQTGYGLFFTNDVGKMSSGVYKTPVRFSAIDWGDLGGTVDDNGSTITWFDGVVWTRYK